MHEASGRRGLGRERYENEAKGTAEVGGFVPALRYSNVGSNHYFVNERPQVIYNDLPSCLHSPPRKEDLGEGANFGSTLKAFLYTARTFNTDFLPARSSISMLSNAFQEPTWRPSEQLLSRRGSTRSGEDMIRT
jgi:hypothetical protein